MKSVVEGSSLKRNQEEKRGQETRKFSEDVNLWLDEEHVHPI